MRYFSPEQTKDERLDIRSDLYSLGCIMHVLFTGQEVFAKLDGYRLLQAKSRGQVDTSAFQNLNLRASDKERRKASENVTALVRRAISGNKKFRYSSPHELKEDLSRVSQGKDLQRSTYDAVKEIEKDNGLGVRNDKPGANRGSGGSGADSTSSNHRMRAGFLISTVVLLLSGAGYLFCVNHCFGPLIVAPAATVGPASIDRSPGARAVPKIRR
jgi:serine/threonine protein kinase